MEEYLGCTPKDDVEGCLQDMHWCVALAAAASAAGGATKHSPKHSPQPQAPWGWGGFRISMLACLDLPVCPRIKQNTSDFRGCLPEKA